MTINYYPNEQTVTAAISADEPLLMVISFDGETAYAAPVDEAVEHHVLLTKSGLSSLDIDKYFRILFDKEGADWTFICPADYLGLTDKHRRITAFYNNGFGAISAALAELGYLVGINIPKRYRRHIDYLKDDSEV